MRMGLSVVFVATLGALILLNACAVVEPPSGGPMDKTPPRLIGVEPDSGALAVGPLSVLRFSFSEKMDRADAYSWLHFFPDQRIRKTKWHGARVAEVFLEQPLPADTLVVVEVSGGLRDAHKVKSRGSRRFPLATGDTISSGSLSGALIYEDGPLANGVVELYGIQPDSLEYFRRPLLRRTETDERGAFNFRWLPVPSGPYLVRAFKDDDENLRPGEREPQRLLPDTLSLDAMTGRASADVTPLFPINSPGRLLADSFPAPPYPGTVWSWAMAVTESDTGFFPEPLARKAQKFFSLQPDSGGVLEDINPGVNRVIAFVDVDGDSTFSVVADSVAADSLNWHLEPWIKVENVVLEPGLATRFSLPAWTDSLTSWSPPEVPSAEPDTMAREPEP